MLTFLINLICVGLASILFFFVSSYILRAILGSNKVMLLASFIISLIITFCIDWGASFFTILLGAICGLVVCFCAVMSGVDICSNCGAWNEFELIEKRNKTSYKGKELVSKSKSIYNKDHEFVGTIEEGYEWQNRTHFEYDAVYRCKKYGNEIIVHKKV